MPKEHCPSGTGIKEMQTPSDCKCRRPWARRMRAVSSLPGELAEEMGGFHQVVQHEPETNASSLPGDENQLGEGRRGRVSFRLARLWLVDYHQTKRCSMNRIVIASEILKIAKELMAIEFDTEEEKKKYQQEHEVRPGTQLTVKRKETPEKGPATPTEKKPEKKPDWYVPDPENRRQRGWFPRPSRTDRLLDMDLLDKEQWKALINPKYEPRVKPPKDAERY